MLAHERDARSAADSLLSLAPSVSSLQPELHVRVDRALVSRGPTIPLRPAVEQAFLPWKYSNLLSPCSRP
jgi:hypothetical protein